MVKVYEIERPGTLDGWSRTAQTEDGRLWAEVPFELVNASPPGLMRMMSLGERWFVLFDSLEAIEKDPEVLEGFRALRQRIKDEGWFDGPPDVEEEGSRSFEFVLAGEDNLGEEEGLEAGRVYLVNSPR